MLLAQCSDGRFTQPGFNTGKRLETNLRCSCHPSIRRKHLFFLWPQGMVSHCVEFAIFQGWSEDTLMKLVSAMGSLFRQSVVCLWAGSAQIHGRSRLCHPQQQQAGPDVLVLTLLIQTAASQSNLQFHLGCPAFPCVGMSQRPGQGEDNLQRRQPLTQVDLPCEMREFPSADHLDTTHPASPVFSAESIILSSSPSKSLCTIDTGFPPAISRAFGGRHQHFIKASLFSDSRSLFVPR